MSDATNITYFDFITNLEFKNLLVRDFEELNNCVENRASKAVLLLSGSIIEAILIDFFINNPPDGMTKTKILKLGLGELIDLAINIELISTRSKDLSSVIKNYRNLIHPGREIRLGEEFDFETATVSFSLVKIILKEIKEKYNQKYGYKADDIYNKIAVDISTGSIYEKLLSKLNEHEKNRLLKMLVNYHVENFEIENARDFKYYIYTLKKVMNNDTILTYCKDLYNLVERGKETEILALFEIFGTNLHLLQNEEIELIMIYIYSIVDGFTFLDSRIHQYKYRRFYSYFSHYLDLPKLKEMYFSLLKSLVSSHGYANEKVKESIRSAYKIMIEDLDDDKIEKCENFIKENVTKEASKEFFNLVKQDDDLPF